MTQHDELEVLPSKGFQKAPRYEVSPFLNRLTVRTRGRRLTVARGTTLIDLKTGELEGVTEIAQVVDVDEGQFIKLFTKDLAIWFDLSKGGMRVFGALLSAVQKSAIGRDMIFFDHKNEFVTKFQISKSAFYRGLDELLDKGFIARHLSPNWFFINAAMFFNGDRARFVREYRIKKKDGRQGELFRSPQNAQITAQPEPPQTDPEMRRQAQEDMEINRLIDEMVQSEMRTLEE